MSKTDISKYTMSISGNTFIKHEGLLALFHENGGTSIVTELLKVTDKGTVIWKATVKGERGEYVAHGDANTDNVNSMVAKHFLRMGETRAINRALRLYNNVGMASVDELGGDSYNE